MTCCGNQGASAGARPVGEDATGIRIEPAAINDHDAVARLLREASLPVPDERDQPVHMLVVREGARVIACAGWEQYGHAALLRSVAVQADRRGADLGKRLVRLVLERLPVLGVRDVYLLTTDAARFFSALGFAPMDRAELPASVQSSRQVADGCCGSAACMHRGFALPQG